MPMRQPTSGDGRQKDIRSGSDVPAAPVCSFPFFLPRIFFTCCCYVLQSPLAQLNYDYSKDVKHILVRRGTIFRAICFTPRVAGSCQHRLNNF
jgi:hypothetical protein